MNYLVIISPGIFQKRTCRKCDLVFVSPVTLYSVTHHLVALPLYFSNLFFQNTTATKREARCSVYAKNKFRRRPELLWILRLFFPLLILLLMADQKSGIDSFLPFFPFPACFHFSVFSDFGFVWDLKL